MSDPNKIVGLVKTQGTTRVYQMDDGSQETREGGTVSWRNNNPGNLKFEYAGSADKTVASKRTPESALTAAQGRYSGILALDQWGNAIFETESAGRAAKAQLLKGSHGESTVPEMLGRYAKDDYTDKANTAAYANSVYAEGDRQGIDLRGKKSMI
jgi:putative chitinase